MYGISSQINIQSKDIFIIQYYDQIRKKVSFSTDSVFKMIDISYLFIFRFEEHLQFSRGGTTGEGENEMNYIISFYFQKS